MAEQFPGAESRDAKIDDLLANDKIEEATELMMDETNMRLKENETYLRIAEEYKPLCIDPIEQVIEKRLAFRAKVLRLAKCEDSTCKDPTRFLEEDFTRKTADFAITTASAALAKMGQTSELEQDSLQFNLIGVFFQNQIRPRVATFARIWANRKNISADWSGERGNQIGWINGSDLIDAAVMDIWRYSVPKFRHPFAYEWLQFFVANCADWSFQSFMLREENWFRPAEHFLMLDILALKGRSIETPEEIANELRNQYFAVYQECHADDSRPTLRDLRCEGVPDLSYWSKEYKSDAYLSEKEFEKLLEKVITTERVNDLISKLALRETKDIEGDDGGESLSSSQFNLESLLDMLEEVHLLVTPEIVTNPMHQMAFAMMWKDNDETISVHPKINCTPLNVRKVRSRAIKILESRIEESDMDSLTSNEREALCWIYQNITPPYRDFARRRKGAQPPPDQWVKNIESGLEKLKTNLGNNPSNN